MIPLFKVRMAESALSKVNSVLYSGYIGQGAVHDEFESEMCRYVGSQNCVLLNSGTAAIKMALRLAGVGPGDYVITTPMTCLATNEPILEAGAIPAWADVCKSTGNISVSSVDRIIKGLGDENIAAIMCMDWGGTPCDLRELSDLASKHEIPIISDSCQSIGSMYCGKHVGGIADYTCFSFQAIKHLTTGDGGMLVCKDKGSADRAKLMRWFGLDRNKSSDMRCYQDPEEYGYKLHMNDIAAAIGLANLAELDKHVDMAKYNGARYDEVFKGNLRVRIPLNPINKVPNRWLYTVIVENASYFIQYLAKKGIAASKVHDRNDTKKMFSNGLVYKDQLAGVDFFDNHHVCIPVGWWLSDSDVKYVIDTVRSY